MQCSCLHRTSSYRPTTSVSVKVSFCPLRMQADTSSFVTFLFFYSSTGRDEGLHSCTRRCQRRPLAPTRTNIGFNTRQCKVNHDNTIYWTSHNIFSSLFISENLVHHKNIKITSVALCCIKYGHIPHPCGLTCLIILSKLNLHHKLTWVHGYISWMSISKGTRGKKM